MLLPPSSVLCAFGAATLCAVALPAQQVRVFAPIGLVAPAGSGPDDDPGAIVEMFENPNLDRYLRRAQSFLDRADYTAAIEVLQDVIEGRTVEVVAARPEEGAPGADAQLDQPAKPEPSTKPKPSKNNRLGRGKGAVPQQLDARNSVFSHHGRLYRPVRRLCHELLSQMPDIGIEIYRTKYEFAADELLQQAQAQGSATALEQVANRYFVTLPAGRAMMLLSDRLMHEGRYRAAVQVLRDLIEIYPAQNRSKLGIRDVWCRFKIALCLRLAGEREAAQGAVQQLAASHPEESLRILGQLESIRDLPTSQLFRRDMVAIDVAEDRTAGITWLAADTEQLVPLWQYRFKNQQPYRDPKPSGRNNRNRMFISGSNRSTAMPFAGRYGPATWITFANERVAGHTVPRALFLEHYRLRLADAASGLLLRETDGVDEPPVARANHPRVRIAASDHALLRPVEDDARRYVVLGHDRNTTTSKEALKSSELVAYERKGWQRAWSSQDWLEGEDGLRSVTFLAAPTVFGERLLLPSMRRDAYTLECIDRSTGRPLWHTSLHSGGSAFFKAPGCPVVVQGGIAFVATNAGCIAAVDAFAGDLRWIRRYERRDPVHKAKARKRRSQRVRRGYGTQYTQTELKSFWPNDLIVHNGLLILAPCDGEVLLGLDAASGDPVWMLDGSTRYAPYGELQSIVGANDTCLFALSDSHLISIELDGGLVRWCRNLPSWDGPKHVGRGRGVVLGSGSGSFGSNGSVVVVPGVRELLVFDTDDKLPMRRLRLPAFGESREPLQGSFNIVASGPWLAVGYQNGVEVYSTSSALFALAGITDDPLRKAMFLTRSGKNAAAEKVLAATIRSTADGHLREQSARQLLALVRQRAAEMAHGGDLGGALTAMDLAAELLVDRPVRLNWHLARIELCKEVGDLRAHEAEQQSLYDYMEGRG